MLSDDWVDVRRFVRPLEAPSGARTDGFLPDPETPVGKHLVPNIRALDEAFDQPCVVILGDPGIGKSVAMSARMRTLGRAAEYFNLAVTPPVDVLKCEPVKRWLAGEQDLHLVLDSIDEASDPAFPNHLFGVLLRGPPERLRLELACRGTEWPPVLDQGLPKIFGDGGVAIFVMEPLRWCDARAFAEATEVDGDAFLDRVRERDLQPLAARPLTLRLLLRVFRSHETLPEHAPELYDKACLLLCDESSPTRKSARSGSLLEPQERLRIAESLAAATVLAQLKVFTDLHPDDVAPGSLTIAKAAASLPDASPRQIRDVVQSGLFTNLGPSRWGWTHHSFAEFLAARWLMGLTVSQRRQLLAHPFDPRAVPPQLFGLAGWLSCLDPETAGWLAETIPELLLSAPSKAATSDGARGTAFRRYIERVQSREVVSSWWQPHQLRQLEHDEIEVQLMAVLRDPNPDTDFVPVRVAIDIVKALHCVAMREPLCALAHNREVPAHIRRDALQAAWRVCDVPEVLVPTTRELAQRGDPTDADESIRAAAIQTLWPEYLTVEQLLELLSPPRNQRYHGRYRELFWSIPEQLHAADLVVALRWACTRSAVAGPCENDAIEQMIGAVCARSWKFLSDEAVAIELGKTAGVLLHHHRSVFGRDVGDVDLAQDTERRRTLVRSIVTHSEVWESAFRLVEPVGQGRLIDAEDAAWALEQYRASDGRSRARWGGVICCLVDWGRNDAVLDLVLAEVRDAQHSELLPFPRYLIVDSEEARKARTEYEELVRREREYAKSVEELSKRRPPPPDPIVAARAAVKGNLDDWWLLIDRLRRRTGYHGRSDPLRLLDWKERGEDERQALVAVARAYVLRAAPAAEEWLHKPDIRYLPADAGVLMLLLLRRVDAKWFEDHASRLARFWAPSVVGYDVSELADVPQRQLFSELLSLCATTADEELDRALRLLLGRERRRTHAKMSVLAYLPPHPRISRRLGRTLMTSGLSFTAYQQVLACLLRTDRETGLAFARKQLRVGERSRAPRFGRELARSRRRRARKRSRPFGPRPLGRDVYLCRALTEAGVAGWELMWSVCRHRHSLALHVLSRGFSQEATKSLFAEGSAELLAELYAWLECHRPLATDVDLWDDDIRFRRQLVRTLADRGTEDALDALHGLRSQRPHNEFLRACCHDAIRAHHQASWTAPRFNDLVDLAARTDRRLVRSNDDLMEATVEALRVYERELHGETPAVVDLWSYENVGGKKTYWPKDEPDLSDHLARSLRRNLERTMVNREVEIRPTEHDRAGQLVDLLIEALDPTSAERFSVVVEVKGCWNNDLETDLEQQLVGRYLSRGGLTHGIYLVGWYACASWTKKGDRRRSRSRSRDRRTVESLLQAQAEMASTAPRSVRVVGLDVSI